MNSFRRFAPRLDSSGLLALAVTILGQRQAVSACRVTDGTDTGAPDSFRFDEVKADTHAPRLTDVEVVRNAATTTSEGYIDSFEMPGARLQWQGIE